MAQNYTRQSSFNDGDTISASLFNDEYNQLVNSFSYSSSSESGTGHRHDGSAGQGGNIYRIGDLDFFNKIEADSTNNRWGFWVEVGGSAVEQVRIQDGAVLPVTTNDIDLGSGSLEFKDLHLSGSASFAGASTSADISFGDNNKAIFGAGSDLQIYHSGTHSFISDQGTGNMLVLADNFEVNSASNTANKITAATGGAVTLFHNNSAKLATTSTGIDVTGTVTADGLTVDGVVEVSSNFPAINLMEADTVDNNFRLFVNGGKFSLQELNDAKSVATDRVVVDTSGNVGIGTSTPATALDVDGTVTADGLTVDTDTGITLKDGADTRTANLFLDGGAFQQYVTGSADIHFYSTDSKTLRMAITGNTGDISFYEDTGTTAKLFWDASAESLGIGTTSPNAMLTLDKDVAILYDATDDDAQRSGTTTLAITNENGTQNTFAQIAFDLAASGQSIARIVALNDGASTSALTFVTEGSNTKREVMRLDGSGNVGIGTSSPASILEVSSSSSTVWDTSWTGADAYTPKAHEVEIANQVDNTPGSFAGLFFKAGETSSESGINAARIAAIRESAIDTSLAFSTRESSGMYERMRIDSSGNLLVGKTATGYSANGAEITSTGLLYLPAGSASAPALTFSGDTNTGIGFGGADILYFTNGGSESGRFDASGNLLVGTTSTGLYNTSSVTGVQIDGTNANISIARSNGRPIDLNRLASDGEIARFSKDGTTVGSIGALSSRLFIGSDDTFLTFQGASDRIYPALSSGGVRDAAIDLGYSAGRFKDLYLSGTTFADGCFVTTGALSATPSGAAAVLSSSGNEARIRAYGATAGTGYLAFRVGGGGGSADSEAMRIDSSGNLLVGKTASDTSSAGHELRPGSFAAHTVDGDVALNLRRLNSDGAIARFQKDGTTVGSIGTVDGDFNVFASASGHKGLRFGSGYIAPTGNSTTIEDATTDLGLSSHRFKDLYLSGGAYLGGTGAANKLDDYEEGTFTATLRGTSEPATLLTSSSTYRKIGATVHFCIAFELVTTTGYSGDLEITGLPFAHITGRRSVVNIALFNDGVWSAGEQLVGIVTSGATNVQFYRLRSANTWQRVQFHTAGSSRYFWATGTYTTTS